MSSWYKSTFGRDYLSLYPHRNAEEAARDVHALVRWLDPPRDEPLLDLCCGPGRHLIALHRAGFTQLTGLDLSVDLLAEAHRRLDAAAIGDVSLIHADMRNIPGINVYATIISLFTSFGYFDRPHEDRQVLTSAYRALRPGGRLLLDTLNRDYVQAHLVPQETGDLDGRHVEIRRWVTQDGLRVEKETRISRPGSPTATYHESVRMYGRVEMEEMLRNSGFVDSRFYGDLDGRAFSSTSPRLVCSASKASP